MKKPIPTALIAGILALAGLQARAEQAPVADRSLDQRIEALAEVPDVLSTAGAALAHARRALEHARELERAGQHAAAARARAIARAAVVLAERRLARDRERSTLRAAERRLADAQQRAERSRDALERALARYESVRSDREPDQPGAPTTAPEEEDAP